MDPFAGSNRSVVARYLAGEMSLDSAASQLAQLWKEVARVEGPAKQRTRSRWPGEAGDTLRSPALRHSMTSFVSLRAMSLERSGLSKSRSYGTSPITRGNSRSAIQKTGASRTFSSTSRIPSWTPHGPPARAIQTTPSTTWMVPGAVHATELLWRAWASYHIAPGKVPPNMRLKLAGPSPKA